MRLKCQLTNELLCHLLDNLQAVVWVCGTAAHQSHQAPHPCQCSSGVRVPFQSERGLSQPLEGQVCQLRLHLRTGLDKGLGFIHCSNHGILCHIVECLNITENEKCWILSWHITNDRCAVIVNANQEVLAKFRACSLRAFPDRHESSWCCPHNGNWTPECYNGDN